MSQNKNKTFSNKFRALNELPSLKTFLGIFRIIGKDLQCIKAIFLF